MAKPTSPAKKITCSTVPLRGTSTLVPSASFAVAAPPSAWNGLDGTRLSSMSSAPGTSFGV